LSFELCLRGAVVLSTGIFTVSLSTLVILTGIYLWAFDTCDNALNCNTKEVSYAIASYALGASAVSICNRIGGSIYNKAASMSNVLLASYIRDRILFEANDVRQPQVIADLVGHNVADVAGVTADLFGSFTQAVAATLGILASSTNTLQWPTTPDMIPRQPLIEHWSIMCLPLVIFMSATCVTAGIFLCFRYCFRPRLDNDEHMRSILMIQNVIAVGVQALFMFFFCMVILPDKFYVDYFLHLGTHSPGSLITHNYEIAFCTTVGLLCGVFASLIGLHHAHVGLGPVTEVQYSSYPDAKKEKWFYEHIQDAFSPPSKEAVISDESKEYQRLEQQQNVKFESRVPIGTIVGLAVGYRATVLACVNIAVGIYIAHCLGRGLGVAFAAMGLLGCVPMVMVTVTMAPMSRNAYSIADLCISPYHEDRDRILGCLQPLQSCGHNVLAMAQGYSTAAAAMVCFALVSAFVLRADVQRADVSILHPLPMAGLLIGAMLPFLLANLVMRGVFDGAQAIAKNSQYQYGARIFDDWAEEEMPAAERRQLQFALMKHIKFPDFKGVVDVAVRYTTKHLSMIIMLILFMPLSTGLLFGRAAVCGMVLGMMISGFSFTISAASSGTAWAGTRLLLQMQQTRKTEYPLPNYFESMHELDKAQNELCEAGAENNEGKIGMPDKWWPQEEEAFLVVLESPECKQNVDEISELMSSVPQPSYAKQIKEHFTKISTELSKYGVEHDPKNCEIQFWKVQRDESEPSAAYKCAQNLEAVGDALKDAVAPAVNIMMKEVAILCLVFGPYFASSRGGYGSLGCDLTAHCDGTKYPMQFFDYIIVIAYGIAACWGAVLFINYTVLPNCGSEPANLRDCCGYWCGAPHDNFGNALPVWHPDYADKDVAGDDDESEFDAGETQGLLEKEASTPYYGGED
jgi:K(+)-stimulated pyrophosphate-energized sodium pump